MMRAIAAASAVQPRVERLKPSVEPRITTPQNYGPRKKSRAAVVPSGSSAARDFDKKFKQSPTQFMQLRRIRRELGVSSAEIYELAEFNSVPIFEVNKESYIHRSDLKFIERAHQRRGGLVSLRTVGSSFNIAIRKVSAACKTLGICSALGPDGDKWISTPDYIRLRKHLERKIVRAHAKTTKIKTTSNVKKTRSVSVKPKPQGLPLINSDRGFENWRQGEGKALLKRAKKVGSSSGGPAYWKEVSGGLPTLGRGHK